MYVRSLEMQHMCPQSHFLFFLQPCLCVSPICLADSSLLAPICQGGSSRSCLVTSKIWTLREPHKSKWILVIPKHNCLWAISSLFDSTFISFNVPRLHKSHLVDNSGSTFYFKLFFTEKEQVVSSINNAENSSSNIEYGVSNQIKISISLGQPMSFSQILSKMS